MSTSKSTKQKIIYVKHEYDDQYEESTNQSEIDLENQPELLVSCKDCNDTYTAFHISKRFVVIQIDSTDTLVKIEHPCQSELLHVHIIEHLYREIDLDGNEFDEVSGHTIFIFFRDHILRIRLTTLEDGSSLFVECKADFSFCIPETETVSFRIIEDERNERLRACLVLDEHGCKKIKIFEFSLFRDDEHRLFTKTKEIFFRISQNFTGIEFSLEEGYIMLTMTLKYNGKSTEFPINIYFIEIDEPNLIFLLNEGNRCILAKRRHLRIFQQEGFESVATISVNHREFPEMKECANALFGLNMYPIALWNVDSDSDLDSDSDSDLDSDLDSDSDSDLDSDSDSDLDSDLDSDSD
jgi:hypothetical protein